MRSSAARAADHLAVMLPALDSALAHPGHGNDSERRRPVRSAGIPTPVLGAAAVAVAVDRVAAEELRRLLLVRRLLGVAGPPRRRPASGTATRLAQIGDLADLLSAVPAAAPVLAATQRRLRRAAGDAARAVSREPARLRITATDEVVSEALARLSAEKALLTTEQVAKRAGVATGTVRWWVHTGGLSSTRRAGAHHLFDPADVDLFLTARAGVAAA